MNVVVLVVDTVRRDRLSLYNRDIDFTPNFLRFSKSSDVYLNAFSQAPWSFPSQLSFLSGLYPWQHQGNQLKPFLGDEVDLLPVKLKDEGYFTSIIHNNTWLTPITGVTKDFDEERTISNKSKYLHSFWKWLGKNNLNNVQRKLILSSSKLNLLNTSKDRYGVLDQIKSIKRFLESHSERDFFCYINLVESHYPYNPPEKYKKRHGVNLDVGDLKSMPLEYGGKIFEEELEVLNRLYNAEIDFLDDLFGKVLGLFKEYGVYEDSLFIVFSDHGELIGEEGKFGHHFSTNKHLINVPLMIKRPGDDGEVIKDVIELREIYSMILREVGVNHLDNNKLMDGYACGMYEKPVIYKEKLDSFYDYCLSDVFYFATENDVCRVNKSVK
ncbi:sulfatase-like hydrolase/transferase [Methanonatronarchaeum sp. AMET-Sl]|uniref:sulfatase-like hydrolase/transferase n=1 Tax=Methanonatronarchaeum sp. AMET-Sl TaxID=3037654 RepID=UPI00244E1124|nr:sulfatase-like hydrolase/transferase [Methanonatronarchaeum sp. AMET-Sl]WGI17477.1 sulfatase-like hydrolase/transferase [Methanonatronarchaeum sp. AMET-Sl]